MKSTVRLLIACLVLFGLGAGSLSAAAPASVNANLDHRLKFRIDGRDWISPSAPLSYKGTTYLPVRAVSNALGLDIKYEASSGSIIILTGKSGASAPGGGLTAAGEKSRGLEPVVAKADPNLKFLIDGAQWTPSAPPLSYKGTTYLPVRAISGALGLDIKYESATLTIHVASGKSSGTGGSGGSAPSAATLPLFDSRYEQGGYELHTGQSDKLTYAGKKYSKLLYTPYGYQNLYVYPKGKYATLALHIASTEAAVVRFTDDNGEQLKTANIPKGTVTEIELDVSKFTGDRYVTIYIEPAVSDLEGEVFIFETSHYK